MNPKPLALALSLAACSAEPSEIVEPAAEDFELAKSTRESVGELEIPGYIGLLNLPDELGGAVIDCRQSFDDENSDKIVDLDYDSFTSVDPSGSCKLANAQPVSGNFRSFNFATKSSIEIYHPDDSAFDRTYSIIRDGEHVEEVAVEDRWHSNGQLAQSFVITNEVDSCDLISKIGNSEYTTTITGVECDPYLNGAKEAIKSFRASLKGKFLLVTDPDSDFSVLLTL